MGNVIENIKKSIDQDDFNNNNDMLQEPINNKINYSFNINNKSNVNSNIFPSLQSLSESSSYNVDNINNNSDNSTTIYVDQDKITEGRDYYESIKCNLCYRLAINNNKLFNCCEQIVCGQCTNDWLSKKSNCPNCRTENPTVTNLNKFILRIFDNLRFRCINNGSGCKEQSLTAINLKEHENSCICNKPNNIIANSSSIEANNYVSSNYYNDDTLITDYYKHSFK